MNPLSIPGASPDRAGEWERHYDSLTTDRSKIDFLLMLKERRDRYADQIAGHVLSILVLRWEHERFMP